MILEQKGKKRKPKLIICGASTYSRDWDYERIRRLQTKCVHSCIAIWRILPDLLPRAIEVLLIIVILPTSTTPYKTLRSPQIWHYIDERERF